MGSNHKTGLKYIYTHYLGLSIQASTPDNVNGLQCTCVLIYIYITTYFGGQKGVANLGESKDDFEGVEKANLASSGS